MTDFSNLVRTTPRRWLVTGSAGFIGSHLVENLLKLGQNVVSIDNFSTGHQHNLDQVRALVGEEAWSRHRFIKGDITDPQFCQEVCSGIDVVLQQAALGSVPRSLTDPLLTHAANATGFLNMLNGARLAGVKRFIYAASSSTYGDHPQLPKVEDVIGKPLSPYAVTKYMNELYADVFSRCYGMETIGLRYFNVFGPRQDPFGPYAAVIPRWVDAMLSGQQCIINGDGTTSRDFCYIANVVQANLLAATTDNPAAINQVYNVAYGQSTTLNALHELLASGLHTHKPNVKIASPLYRDFRAGDIRHSLADIGKAKELLGYLPQYTAKSGITESIAWYVDNAVQH